MTITIILLALLILVWVAVVLVYSHVQAQKAEREAAAKRHAELMAYFHSVTRYGDRLHVIQTPDHF